MQSQLKKGIIEICVLKLISEHHLSGVDIIEQMNHVLSISENTVYPILRRLHAQELLASYKAPSDFGAPRKVYQLTQKGKDHLSSMMHEWQQFLNDVNQILGGSND